MSDIVAFFVDMSFLLVSIAFSLFSLVLIGYMVSGICHFFFKLS